MLKEQLTSEKSTYEAKLAQLSKEVTDLKSQY